MRGPSLRSHLFHFRDSGSRPSDDKRVCFLAPLLAVIRARGHAPVSARQRRKAGNELIMASGLDDQWRLRPRLEHVRLAVAGMKKEWN